MKIHDWFDKLEQMLTVEAELAGLLGHSTMIGNAREFLVTRVLKTVLPPAVHVGSGQVIAFDGSRSKQLDVILYDSRFPVLESQAGVGLYLLEGTIASIEVKSELTSEKLHEALDNCLSVKFTRDMANELSPIYEVPATYIFSFRSTMQPTTVELAIKNWIQSNPIEVGELPEIISGGSFVAVSHGRWLQVFQNQKVGESDLVTKPRAMHIYPTQRKFGLLLSNLLTTVAARFGENGRQALSRWQLDRDYLNELRQSEVFPVDFN